MPELTPFAPRQVWTYKGASLPGSRVIIGRIDAGTPGEERIISISVTNIFLPDPQTGRPVPRTAGHVPMGEHALRSSVLDLIGEADSAADFAEGYKIWRDAYDRGKAGYFTVQVSELEHIFATLLAPKADLPH